MSIESVQVFYLNKTVCTISNVLLFIYFLGSLYYSRIFQINVGMLSKFSEFILIGMMTFLALVMNIRSFKMYHLFHYVNNNFHLAANKREETKLVTVFLALLGANLVACVIDFDMTSHALGTNLMTVLSVAQLTSIINILRTKLKQINRERYLTRNIFNYLHEQTYICDLIQETNSLFNLHLLAILLTEFFHLVCSTCYLIQHFRVIHLYTLFLHTFIILHIVVKVCYTTQYQISYSSRMIINFIVSRKNPELNQNLDYVLECLSFNSKSFTIYKLISLDLALLINIFGAVLTISIILIQIQISNDAAASKITLNATLTNSTRNNTSLVPMYHHIHNL
uniref:Gustatory receptor n=1 Tax=Cacopsylla melanoneura TaxID=428564 RepID=A0A8D9E8S1_9HEMI